VRVRVEIPPPHFLEQGDHADQDETWQSDGHDEPQERDCLSSPHEAPLPFGDTNTDRKRCCIPLHFDEHLLQHDHAPNSQSTFLADDGRMSN